MDIDQLIQRLQEIKAKHGGEIDAGFKEDNYFIESMFVDVKYVDRHNRFVADEFQSDAKIVVVIG